MSVLSAEDKSFFDENGYVIVHDAVPPENLTAMVDAIWAFLGADPDDPDTWYRIQPREKEPDKKGPISLAGMVEIYQHQAIWNNRQHPRVHGAFADIWGTEELWVSLDRANMKPPVRADHPEWNHEGFIHWDADTSKLPVPFGVQGVLYLTDTGENQGGFQCVPGFPKRFDEWVRTQPADRNPSRPDLTGLDVKSIPGKAGDLLIWHRLLPHGNGHNTSDRPRLAQYITMSPAGRRPEGAEERISAWRERRPTPRWPGDPRGWEHRTQPVATLTPLGRKLLGLDPWDQREKENGKREA
jgi:hypothetical protein